MRRVGIVLGLATPGVTYLWLTKGGSYLREFWLGLPPVPEAGSWTLTLRVVALLVAPLCAGVSTLLAILWASSRAIDDATKLAVWITTVPCVAVGIIVALDWAVALAM